MSEGKTTTPTGHPAGIPVLLPHPEQPYGNAGAEPSQTLEIKVMDKYENTISCKIRRSTKLKKVMDAFCHSCGIPHKSVHFLFDGSRVQPTDSSHTVSLCYVSPLIVKLIYTRFS
jgi:small ubiquitin-related modifier